VEQLKRDALEPKPSLSAAKRRQQVAAGVSLRNKNQEKLKAAKRRQQIFHAVAGLLSPLRGF
jgi:hypothetical protein